MNKQESKYFNTASLFDEALIKLLSIKDFEYITVKEICQQAGFNRSTFYLHYESTDELLNETIKYLTDKLVKYFDKESREFPQKIDSSNKEDLNLINEKYLRPYLNFIKDNKKIFIYAFKNPQVMKSEEKYSNLEKYIFNPILDKYEIKPYKKKYYLEFYMGGLMGIIKNWTLNDCEDEIEKVINIIIECVRP